MKRENQLALWSTSKCKDIASTALQKLRRLEEADQHGFCICVSCGDRRPWKEMQGGHYVGGRTNGVLFVEHNIHPQCQRCNKWANSSDAATGYALYMIDRYGRDRVEEIKSMRHVPETFTKDDLLDLHDHYKERIKIELKRIEDGLPKRM